MSTILRHLLRSVFVFLFAHAADPEDPPVEPELNEDPTEVEPDIETLGDDPGESVDPEPAAAPRGARVDTERRAEEAAREAREAREAVQALRQQMSQPAANNPEQRQWEEEERQLADPQTDPQTRWQIQANRTLRDAHRQSQMAMARAQDMADLAEYNTKAIANPIYSKFKDQVEKELTEWRGKGANPPRQAILERVVGRAVLEGKFKAKTPAAAVNRTKPNTPRSDVPARSGATDRDKRRARLENISI